MIARIPHVTCSRLKRVDAIVRKCLRDRTGAEDMDDLLGVRVLVSRDADLLLIRKQLEACPLHVRTRDYVVTPKPSGYRAIHIVFQVPNPLSNSGRCPRYEIQVRTWPHHLWACTSESLGQRTKEGDGSAEDMQFLRGLGDRLCSVDAAGFPMPTYEPTSHRNYYALRIRPRPFRRSITNLGPSLESALAVFGSNERDGATGGNVQTVLLNSVSEHDFRITHISLFPRSLLAELVEGQDCIVPEKVIRRLVG